MDLDNHKFLQRVGDEKTILPKKLHRSLVASLDMAKSGTKTECQTIRTQLLVSSAISLEKVLEYVLRVSCIIRIIRVSPYYIV